MTRVAVASHNPIKALAVEQAFRCMFPERDVEIRPVSVESGVSDQPDTSDETRKGAVNRARAAKAALPDADYWVGIEGGIEDSPAGMEAFAWIVALSTRGFGQGKTASFFLPDDVANLVRGGLELGAADDIAFGRENSKQKDGAIGLLTGNVIDRRGLYEHGVIMALIPFKNDALYPAEAEA